MRAFFSLVIQVNKPIFRAKVWFPHCMKLICCSQNIWISNFLRNFGLILVLNHLFNEFVLIAAQIENKRISHQCSVELVSSHSISRESSVMLHESPTLHFKLKMECLCTCAHTNGINKSYENYYISFRFENECVSHVPKSASDCEVLLSMRSYQYYETKTIIWFEWICC